MTQVKHSQQNVLLPWRFSDFKLTFQIIQTWILNLISVKLEQQDKSNSCTNTRVSRMMDIITDLLRHYLSDNRASSNNETRSSIIRLHLDFQLKQNCPAAVFSMERGECLGDSVKTDVTFNYID